MFKMQFGVYRKPGMTQEEFLDYWRTVHGPLAVKHAKALRIKKYVQLHGGDYEITRRVTESRGSQPPHDGVAQIWWESEEDRMAAANSPEGQAASKIMAEDELRFCDMARSTVIFGHEHVVIDDTK
jgi:uncharacterized protein (TIGR02118 family)